MEDWKNKNLLQKTSYSLNGLRVAFMSEKAVRLEGLALAVFTGLAAFRGLPPHSILTVFLLCLAPILIELINTSVESIIDLLLGPIYREEVKGAKDMLSAAVCLGLCISYGLSAIVIFF